MMRSLKDSQALDLCSPKRNVYVHIVRMSLFIKETHTSKDMDLHLYVTLREGIHQGTACGLARPQGSTKDRKRPQSVGLSLAARAGDIRCEGSVFLLVGVSSHPSTSWPLCNTQ